jgi:protein TonB
VPAYAKVERTQRPRERALALGAVVVVQGALGLALLIGLRVEVGRPTEAVQRLVEIAVPRAPKPPPPPRTIEKAALRPSSARAAAPAPLGGSPGPRPAHAPPSVTPVVALQPIVAPSGGGSGSGPAVGSGAGGGAGGTGYGDSGGGWTELEQIAGEITPRDYPRRLARAGIGGRVGLLFTVGANGRVTRCTVTQSSGVPELDALTCRLIQQRFVFRPATDRNGRPVPDEVEGEHVWDVGGRY